MMYIKLPTGLYDYSTANVNSTPINVNNPILSVPITSLTPRVVTVVIQSLKNIAYIPSQSTLTSLSMLSVSTTTSDLTKILGQTSISSSLLAPTDAYDIKNSSAIRTNTKSSDITNISIVYNSILGTGSAKLQITLPINQNVFNTDSGCYYGASLTPCNIIVINSTDMLISYPINSTILLTKIQNLYPNPNLISLRLYVSSSLWSASSPSSTIYQ